MYLLRLNFVSLVHNILIKVLTVNDRDNADTLKTVSTKEYQSTNARHLSLTICCAKAYFDDCISI